MTTNRKTTIFIDATALKSSKCIRRLMHTVYHGYAPLQRDFKMEYGVSFHKFVAHWYEHRDIEEAMTQAIAYYMSPDIYIPEGDFRTVAHLGMCCEQYARLYESDVFQPLRDADGKILVEQRFAISPFFEDEFCRIIPFGVIDVIGTYSNYLVFMDHKTTAAYDPADYFVTYLMSGQMRMYKLALTYLATANPSTFGPLREAYSLIDGIFINKSGKNKFERSVPMEITDTQVAEYKELLFGTCRRISYALQRAEFPKEGLVNGACEGEYFKRCPFFNACVTSDLDEAEAIIDGNFQRRPYNPDIFVERD